MPSYVPNKFHTDSLNNYVAKLQHSAIKEQLQWAITGSASNQEPLQRLNLLKVLFSIFFLLYCCSSFAFHDCIIVSQ